MGNNKAPAPLCDLTQFIRTSPGIEVGYWVRIDQIDGVWPGSDGSQPTLLVAGAWIPTDAATIKILFGDLK